MYRKSIIVCLNCTYQKTLSFHEIETRCLVLLLLLSKHVHLLLRLSHVHTTKHVVLLLLLLLLLHHLWLESIVDKLLLNWLLHSCHHGVWLEWLLHLLLRHLRSSISHLHECGLATLLSLERLTSGSSTSQVNISFVLLSIRTEHIIKVRWTTIEN